VLAKSCARIFFRNAINVGLPVLICDTEGIGDGDALEADLAASTVRDLNNGLVLTFGRIPEVMRLILDEGGLVAYIRKYGSLRLPQAGAS